MSVCLFVCVFRVSMIFHVNAGPITIKRVRYVLGTFGQKKWIVFSRRYHRCCQVISRFARSRRLAFGNITVNRAKGLKRALTWLTLIRINERA